MCSLSVARFRNDKIKTLSLNRALQILKFERLRQMNEPPYSTSLVMLQLVAVFFLQEQKYLHQYQKKS